MAIDRIRDVKNLARSIIFLPLSVIYLLLFFCDSFIRIIPIKDPITDTANTRSKAGIAIAYILGRNKFNTAGSSRKG